MLARTSRRLADLTNRRTRKPAEAATSGTSAASGNVCVVVGVPPSRRCGDGWLRDWGQRRKSRMPTLIRNPNPVPCHWRRPGPITLAGDTDVSEVDPVLVARGDTGVRVQPPGTMPISLGSGSNQPDHAPTSEASFTCRLPSGRRRLVTELNLADFRTQPELSQHDGARDRRSMVNAVPFAGREVEE